MAVTKKDNLTREKALQMVAFTLEKKAHNPVVLDVSKITSLCDYFVICSGETEIQARAIFENVIDKCKENNIVIHHRQNDRSYQWNIVDTFDVIVHIFNDDSRQYYHLEKLWEHARRIRIPSHLSK